MLAKDKKEKKTLSEKQKKPKKAATNPFIGTNKESSLHKSLKLHYSGSNGVTETLLGPYICDGMTGKGEIVEVQTGSFGPLEEKIRFFAKKNKVRIIHPIYAQKYIEVYDTSGIMKWRRKSPIKGSAWDLFTVLIYAPELALLKNVVIELAVIDVIEKRIDDGKGSWRRKGISICDRFISGWRQPVVLAKSRDYYQFAPFKRNEEFTVRDLAKKAEINIALAGKTLYVLGRLNLVKQIGKKGNAFIYKRR